MDKLTKVKNDDEKELENALKYIFSNYNEDDYNEIAYISGNIHIAEEICRESHNIVSAVLEEKVKNSLEIGAGYGTFTGKLADLSLKLYCVEADEKKTEINQIRQKDRSNIIFLKNEETNRVYDLIFVNGADESIYEYGYSSVGEMYARLKTCVSDNGKIVFVLANKYGEYLSKDKYDCNQIKTELLCEGAGAVSIRYPYPGIRKNMLYNFSDLRRPYISELYFDKNTCKMGDYEELLKENSYADCFLVEISKYEDKTIEYSKMSIMRRKPFRIRTDLVVDSKGVQSIIKRTVNDYENHINKMVESYDNLKKVFGSSIIGVNKLLKASKNSVEFEFLEGEVLFDVISSEMKQNEQKACEYIYRYAQILRSKSYRKFEYTNQFKEVFGEHLTDTEFYSMDYTDVDLCFDNFIINDGKWVIIDYEFCFDFLIPVDFVIYRSVFYFFNKIGAEENAKCKANVLRKLGLAKYASEFHKMEVEFQKYVVGDRKYQKQVFYKSNTENRDCVSAVNEIKNMLRQVSGEGR